MSYFFPDLRYGHHISSYVCTRLFFVPRAVVRILEVGDTLVNFGEILSNRAL